MSVSPISADMAVRDLFDLHRHQTTTILRPRRSVGGWLLLNEGLHDVAVCRSDISAIDGEGGLLFYRDKTIECVVAEHSFDSLVPFLAFNTQDPAAPGNLSEHFRLVPELQSVLDALPAELHPMNALAAAISVLPALEHELLGSRPAVEDRIAFLVAQTAVSATYWTHKLSGTTWIPRLSCKRLADAVAGQLSSGRSEAENEASANMLDTLLMLHAEHEQNCSTMTVRTVASAGTGLYESVAAGIYAFKGPRHGGASEDVARMYQDLVDSGVAAEEFVASKLARKERISGFGHRVYRCWDPRAAIMARILREQPTMPGTAGEMQSLALALVSATEGQAYFAERRIYPNPDLFNGILFRAVGFPAAMNGTVLCMSRVAGWAAHWLEQVADGLPIVRPRQIPKS